MNAKRRWFLLVFGVVSLLAAGGFLVIRNLASKMALARMEAALGTESRQILDDSREFTLYALQPDSMRLDNPQVLKTKPTFHGYLILGQTQMTDAKAKADLLTALYEGIGNCRREEMALCFEPRHGIHVVGKNQSIDLVICFQCKQILVYDKQGERYVPVTDSPKSVFDHALSKVALPLANR